RCRWRDVTKVNGDMLKWGLEADRKELGDEGDNLVVLSEITLNNLTSDGELEKKDFLARADILCTLGHTVMISNCHKHDVLVNYLDRCKPKHIGIILGVPNLLELFKEKYYKYSAGEIMR